MGHIIELKKAAVAYGIDQALSGYEAKPPFGVTMTEIKGGNCNALLARIRAHRERTPADWALWMAAIEAAHPGTFTWVEFRPYKFVRPPALVKRMDCSTFAILGRWLAHEPDPNGTGYNGYGNSGSLFARGTKVSTARASDLVFYHAAGDPDATSHVAVAISSTEVVSMGEAGDPRKKALSNCADPNLTLVGIRRY